MKVGDEVKVTGRPAKLRPEWAWTQEYVGRTGRVSNTLPANGVPQRDGMAVGVDFGEDIVYFGSSYLDLVEGKKEGAA